MREESHLTQVELQKLKGIHKELKPAALVFKAFSEITRPRQSIDLRRLRARLIEEGYDISQQDVLEVCKRLQEKGFGRLILGQGTDPHRFKWGKYNVMRVGREVMEEINPPLKPTEPVKAAPGQDATGKTKIIAVWQSPSGVRQKFEFASRAEIVDLRDFLTSLL